MSRPVIGICAAIDRARWAVWEDVEANVSQRTYSRAIAARRRAAGDPARPRRARGRARAGRSTLLDAPDPQRRLRPRPLLLRRRAGRAHDRHHTASATRFEIALAARRARARAAGAGNLPRHADAQRRARRRPSSSTCRPPSTHMHTPGSLQRPRGRARSPARCAAARRRRASRLAVRSHHHQGLGRLGEGLTVTGRAQPATAWSRRSSSPDRALRARDPLAPRGRGGRDVAGSSPRPRGGGGMSA